MINRDAVHKIIILGLPVLLATLLCIPLKIVADSAGVSKPGHDIDPGDTSVFNKTGIYVIDANTILNSIDNNESVVFMPETAPLGSVTKHDGLLWTQSDYMKIVRVFFDFVWKETLSSEWGIHKMSFEPTCKENPAGFEYATFVFYQLIFRKGELRYSARALEISQQYEQVLWGGDSTFFRPIFGANLIDMNNINISADDVLSIAEKNGGKEIRQSAQNNCEIHLYFDKDWEVDYVGPKGLPILKLIIDSNTGEIVSSR